MQIKTSKYRIRCDRPQRRRYGVILADPPWQYKAWSIKGTGRSAEQHYPIMTLKDIKLLPVRKIATEDCVLFLWVTMPCLRQAFEVIDAWGFVYKTVAFTWAKQTKHGKWAFGNGHWTRANPELCLLCTRGNPKRVSKSVRQLIVEKIGEHSEKPARVHSDIEMLMGNTISKIELFARKETKNWTCIGNEINGEDIRISLRKIING